MILNSIVVAFTIHSNDGKTRPLQGVMTNYGYVLPDPNTPNRFTVFFTGGLLEPNGETDVTEWKNIFGEAAPKRLLSERARLLAAKVFLGASVSDAMEEDGSMSYFLKRPIGGHGSTYMDVSLPRLQSICWQTPLFCHSQYPFRTFVFMTYFDLHIISRLSIWMKHFVL